MSEHSNGEDLGPTSTDDSFLTIQHLSPARLRADRDGFPQIRKLLEIHSLVRHTNRARVDLAALNKSAIVLVCAVWEAFVEDLASDILMNYAIHAADAAALPLALKKTVASVVRSEKNSLTVWDLADDGWRSILRSNAHAIASGNDRRFNSPTWMNVDDFLSKQAGIDTISKSWRWSGVDVTRAREKLDSLLATRNRIAHRAGGQGFTVSKRDATMCLALIQRLATLSLVEADRQTILVTGYSLQPTQTMRISLGDPGEWKYDSVKEATLDAMKEWEPDRDLWERGRA